MALLLPHDVIGTIFQKLELAEQFSVYATCRLFQELSREFVNTLNFSHRRICLKGISIVLHSFPAVTTVNLAGCAIDDLVLQQMVKTLPNVTNLNLSDADGFSTLGLSSLKELTALQSLDISYCLVRDVSALKEIAMGCKLLRRLRCDQVTVADPPVQCLPFCNLQELVHQSQLEQMPLYLLAPALTYLDLSGSAAPTWFSTTLDAVLAPCGPSLRTLILDDWGIQDLQLLSVQNSCPLLQHLSMHMCAVTESGAQALVSALPCLRSVAISFVRMPEDAAAATVRAFVGAGIHVDGGWSLNDERRTATWMPPQGQTSAMVQPPRVHSGADIAGSPVSICIEQLSGMKAQVSVDPAAPLLNALLDIEPLTRVPAYRLRLFATGLMLHINPRTDSLQSLGWSGGVPSGVRLFAIDMYGKSCQAATMLHPRLLPGERESDARYVQRAVRIHEGWPTDVDSGSMRPLLILEWTLEALSLLPPRCRPPLAYPSPDDCEAAPFVWLPLAACPNCRSRTYFGECMRMCDVPQGPVCAALRCEWSAAVAPHVQRALLPLLGSSIDAGCIVVKGGTLNQRLPCGSTLEMLVRNEQLLLQGKWLGQGFVVVVDYQST